MSMFTSLKVFLLHVDSVKNGNVILRSPGISLVHNVTTTLQYIHDGDVSDMSPPLSVSYLHPHRLLRHYCKQFAEITEVPFPEVYEKFLSLTGIFSFDLSWILSATCMTDDLDFYDKLL